MTASFLVLLTVATARPPQDAPVPSLTAAEPTTAHWSGTWRMSVGTGGLVLPAEEARWLSAPHRFACSARLERGLDALLAGAALSLDAGYSPATEDGMVALELGTLAAGLTYYWSGGHRARAWLWDWLAPYARAAVSLAVLRAEEHGRGQTLFIPGLTGSLGARIRLSRRKQDGTARFFGFVEGGYTVRLPRKLRLEQEDDELLHGPSLQLGNANLSGALWTAGMGLAF